MAISPRRVMATWPPPYTSEAWISGSSVTSVRGCPSCCGAAADGRVGDSSTQGTGGPRPWVSQTSGTSSDEALNPDTGGSTLWAGWACLGGCRFLWWGDVHAAQVSLPFGGVHLGPWQDNSVIAAGISCSEVPRVSDKSCKRLSYCILREQC